VSSQAAWLRSRAPAARSSAAVHHPYRPGYRWCRLQSVALNKEIRRFLAAIGRKGGKARMRQVGSQEQSAYARAGWEGLTKKERAGRVKKGWRTRRARQMTKKS